MKTNEFEEFLNDINLTDYQDNKIISRYFFDVEDGWLQLIKNLIIELIEFGWDGKILQVKQKYGGLRFYIQNETVVERTIISKYEKESYNICEICGNLGNQVTKNGWIVTLCEKHI
jgi:hypothetical protein